MKKQMCIAMLLALASGSAFAEWATVGTNEISTLFADLDSMRKTGNVVKMSYLIDYNKRQVHVNGKRYLSTKTHAEYDCAKNEWRQISYAWYAGKMGNGMTVLGDADEPNAGSAQWHAVPPNSGSEVLWKFACVTEPSVVDFSKKR